MDKQTFCHIGFPKTASSTIQNNYFAEVADAVYVSRLENGGDEEYVDQYQFISQAIGTGSKLKEARRQWLEIVNNSKKSKIIFSDERITLPRNENYLTLIERVDNVRKVFGKANILIVIREPFGFLRSLYHHNGILRFKNKGTYPDSFSDWLGSELECSKFLRGNKAQSLHFGELLVRYSQVFGREKVGLFFLEDLKEDAELFYKKLSLFLGCDDSLVGKISVLPPKNVTAERQGMLKILDKMPEFDSPAFPECLKDEAVEIVRRNIYFCDKVLGCDLQKKWSSDKFY